MNDNSKLFKNRFLEAFTRTHIAVPIGLYLILSTYLLFYSKTELSLTWVDLIIYFSAGWIVFSAFEYVMHRFLFHMKEDKPYKKKITYTMHGVHHDFPKDKDRLAMPPIMSLMIAFIIFLIFYPVFGLGTYSFLPGFMFGYAFYLFIHYAVHRYAPPKNYFRFYWIHHSIHHYSQPDRAFGVSSTLWDRLLGTLPRKQTDK